MPSLNLVRSISGTVKTFSRRASGARGWGGWSPHSGHCAHRKPLGFHSWEWRWRVVVKLGSWRVLGLLGAGREELG